MSEQPFRNITDIDQENSSNRNESLDNTENQKVTSSVIGSGTNAVYSDSRGTWWGNPDPTKAPVFISVKGKVTIRASALNTGANIEFRDIEGNLSILIGFENE
jgi:hypothetical protein